MIDTNPIADNRLAQNDEDLIKSVAGEVNSKDKQNNKAQSEIEEQIELGYIKLKSDINKVLSPIVQAMIEAGVDGGLITSLEAEIYSNARMTFFTRVVNSDINNMEEISKNVQSESLKKLKPLFIDGEVSHELSQLKGAPVSEYEAVLKQILKEDKETHDKVEHTSEIKNDYTTGNNWKFRNSDFENLFSSDCGSTDIENLEEHERKLIDYIDKNTSQIEKLINEANSEDPEVQKRAKMILTMSSTVIGYGDVDKRFDELNSAQKENAYYAVFELGRIVNETGDEFSKGLLETFVDTLGIEGFTKEDGTIDLEKIKTKAYKSGIELQQSEEKIMDEEFWISTFENYESVKDFMISSTITTRHRFMISDASRLISHVENGTITLDAAKDEITKSFSTNIDAANQTLAGLVGYSHDDLNSDAREFYNHMVQTILTQYIDAPEGYKIDKYVLKTLEEGIGVVLSPNAIGRLDEKSIQLLEIVLKKNMDLMKNEENGIQYDEELYSLYTERLSVIENFKMGVLPEEQKESIYRIVEKKGEIDKKKTETGEKIGDEALLEDLKIGLTRQINGKGIAAGKVFLEAMRSRYPQNVIEQVEDFINSGEYKTFEIPKQLNNKERRIETKSGFMNMLDTMIDKKGLSKTQEWMEKRITYAKTNREVFIDAALSVLEKQKETDEQFMSKDNVDSREGVFSAIVFAGFEDPKIYERMQQIDRETSTTVVHDTIDAINSNRTVLNKVVNAVQQLAKGLKEKTKEVVQDTKIEFLDASKTKIPGVNMFGKKDRNQEKEDGWEPGD